MATSKGEPTRPWWAKLVDGVSWVGRVVRETFAPRAAQEPLPPPASPYSIIDARGHLPVPARQDRSYLQRPAGAGSRFTWGDFWTGVGTLATGVLGLLGMVKLVEHEDQRYKIFALDPKDANTSALLRYLRKIGLPPEITRRVCFFQVTTKKFLKECKADFLTALVERPAHSALVLRDFVDYELARAAREYNIPVASRNHRDFAHFRDRGGAARAQPVAALVERFPFVYAAPSRIAGNSARVLSSLALANLPRGSKLLLDANIFIDWEGGAHRAENAWLFAACRAKGLQLLVTEHVRDELLGRVEPVHEDLLETFREAMKGEGLGVHAERDPTTRHLRDARVIR